ncbi:hypothetical protein KFZ56_17185 [Virgibacillus sp. NKC19-3]|uniref:hypothetical protein n=1 Tax=Virgibacillus saliphilus TaxID=2831674 RepID=UPI001C9AF5BD|nr:hypothetical protein [Virgibacillus sp. NKC19-3]MBY7144756.1 hypothetical protein [Virgibacillus sp. NKC19-3]
MSNLSCSTNININIISALLSINNNYLKKRQTTNYDERTKLKEGKMQALALNSWLVSMGWIVLNLLVSKAILRGVECEVQ